jgi:hypothetical protein
MNDYFRAVTLGAFTWRNEDRVCLFLSCVRKAGGRWVLLHFMLLAVCLDFPVTLSISRLEPYQLFSRLYGENFRTFLIPELMASGSDAADTASLIDENDFNLFMIEAGYGANTLLPLLALAFIVVLVLHTVFYLLIAFFLGLSRMNMAPLSFGDRMGLAAYSSTLPALVCSLFGLFIPGVHIIVFYFIVMFLAFQRSKLMV